MVKEAVRRGHALAAALGCLHRVGEAEPGTVTPLAPCPGHPGGSGPHPTLASAMEFFLLYWQLVWLQYLCVAQRVGDDCSGGICPMQC